MEFDYDFTKCPICESKMVRYNDEELRCRNGCCKYDIDVNEAGTLVLAFVFNEGSYLLDKYKQDYDCDNYIGIETEGFLRKIDYWRENDRYLVKIMEDQ